MVEKTYKYKESKKQSQAINENLKGNLEIAITDKKNKKVYKIELEKKKEGNDYFIKPILDLEILKNKVISQTAMKKLLKGFKLEFKQLDRKTKTTKPIEMSLVNKNNINVRLLKPNEKWKFHIRYSGTNEVRFIDPIPNFIFSGSYEELESLIHNYIYSKFEWIPKINDDYENPNFEISISMFKDRPIQFIDVNNVVSQFKFIRVNDDENYYIEKKRKYAELINLFNEPIQAINNPPTENCVIYYFNELYKKKKRKIFKLIYNELVEIEKRKKTIYLNDLKTILKKHDITIYIYSIGEYLEFEQYNANYTEKSKCENLVLYIEDNHLYSVKTMKHKNHLTRKSIKDYDDAIIKNVVSVEPVKLLNSIVLGFDMDTSTNEPKFLLFDNDKELLTNNENVKITSKFVKKLGYDKKILSSNTNNFINKIVDKYDINSYSIFPFKVSNDVLLYKNNNIIQNKDDATLLNIDKNKCFSNALFDCPFVPIFNIFTDAKRLYEPKEIIRDHYIYFIEVIEPNEIYYNNGYRTGYFIKKVGGDKHIKIKYVFECEVLRNKENEVINPYSVLINDLYGLAETKEEITFIKDSLNKYIGKMMNPEKSYITYKSNIKCSNINDLKLIHSNNMKSMINNHLDDGIDGINENKLKKDLTFDDVLKIMTCKHDIGYTQDTHNDNMVWNWDIKEKENMNMGQDNKPLHILIRDIAQLYLLDMIQKLNIKNDDIIEINTDCIYIRNSNNYDLTKINVNPNDFKAWKLEKGYKQNQIQNYNLNLNNNEIDTDEYFYSSNNNKYNFNLEYAGGGKTYRIKEEIRKKIKKNHKYSYVILSSFNDFITEYRKEGLNAYTIAHYIYHNKNIQEKNVYVDEFGICSINEILYMFKHNNKTFNLYGDQKQLTPVKSKKVNEEFIKTIATDYNTKWTNKRNTFTKEFYDELIEEKDIENINKIVNTYNSPMKQADKIIAFYNSSCDKYNNMMLKDYNKQFNENIIDVGIPLINTENNLSVKTLKGEIDKIYNRHSFNIIEKKDNEEYVIFDGINKYIVCKEILLKHFKVAYCITLYASQGKTFNKIHFVKEEQDRKALSKDGALYTLISRLRFDNKEKYEIDVLNSNINYDNKEIQNIMNFCLKK